MCWGAGILLSSGVARAAITLDGDIAWRLPFALQWMWPVPLFVLAYFAPESPWNAVRRQKLDLARNSLRRLIGQGASQASEVESTLAYIIFTNEQEHMETEGARLIDCFRGTNLRRTEIVSTAFSLQTHTLLILAELCGLGSSDSLRKRDPGLQRSVPRSRRLCSCRSAQPQYSAVRLLHHRRYHLLVSVPPIWPSDSLYDWTDIHVLLSRGDRRPWLQHQ